VSIADLAQFDDFEMMEQEYALIGHNTRIRFRMGDKVRIRVVAANLDKRQIDFTILELPQQEQTGTKKKRETTFDAPTPKSRPKRKK
jgi:ribonuclease R